MEICFGASLVGGLRVPTREVGGGSAASSDV
jgi:hypothetical protein